MYSADPDMMLAAMRERQAALQRSARTSRLVARRLGMWAVVMRRRPTRAVPLSRLIRHL